MTLAVAAAALVGQSGLASTAAGHAISPVTRRTNQIKGLRKTGLDPSWSAQKVYDYMGRPPDDTYIKLGLACSAWVGGWVRDRDPYFERFGGKRASWAVELCSSAPTKTLRKR